MEINGFAAITDFAVGFKQMLDLFPFQPDGFKIIKKVLMGCF